jgi:hypothetical protein
MFGVKAKVGLTSSSLPDEIISKINTGDDLKDITNTGVRNDFDIMCCYILNMNERLKLVSDTKYMLHSLCFQCQKSHQLFQ